MPRRKRSVLAGGGLAIFLFAAMGCESPQLMATQVRQATDRFYMAVNNVLEGEVTVMGRIWSHRNDVTCNGPLGGRYVGWEQVGASWERTAQKKLGGRIVPRDVRILVQGNLGYVICVEQGENTDADGFPVRIAHRATIVFRKEQNQWKVIHHHADIAPSLQRAAGLRGPLVALVSAAGEEGTVSSEDKTTKVAVRP